MDDESDRKPMILFHPSQFEISFSSFLQFFPGVLVPVVPISFPQVYSYQLSKACSYIHAVGICHRDIKPQNLLVDGKTHSLKLCDFGSAKRLVRGEPNVAYICSRYYRAPELIFGATDYTTAIDIWSAACVTAEMILGQPLFPGESGVDQLVEIIKVRTVYSEFRWQIHVRIDSYDVLDHR